jgi:hypothetical protein
MKTAKRAGSRIAAPKRQKAAASESVRELADLVQSKFPRLEVTEKFGNLSFSFAGKVVGFSRGEHGLALKLPAERVRELGEQRGWQPLVMGKRTMKEWIVAERGARGWSDESKLVREAMEFVKV